MGVRYSDLIDYSRLDPVKRKALNVFASTLKNTERLRVRVAPTGETAAVLDFLDQKFMIALNIESLGTKNLIADELYRESKLRKSIQNNGPEKYYRFLGQDALAMSVTDLVAVGADPIVYVDAIASGDSKWFDDERRVKSLLNGYKIAAEKAGCAIPQGETPTLPGVIYPETLELVGSSIGIINPKERFTYGQKIVEGDTIYGLSSNGICTNGVSKARAIVEKLEERYFTELPNGKTIGEELLMPTPIYVRPILEMFDSEVSLHYISPITGHAWRKIARARFPFTYEIEYVPDPPLIFSVLINLGKNVGFDVSDWENYQVWNMGVFITLIGSKNDENEITRICKKHGIEVYTLGKVKKGERKVVIKPKKLVYID